MMQSDSSLALIPDERIVNKVLLIRGIKVMLDQDLAELYGVETKVLNQAVRRNRDRFPEDFMFRLSKEEFDNMRSQLVTSSWGGRTTPPYAFTEQGVAMLSAVLRSETAVNVSIQIMQAFVVMRKILLENNQIFHRLDSIETRQLQYQSETEKNLNKCLMLYKAMI